MKTDEELRAEAKTEEWAFMSSEKFELLGRGEVYMVTNPINCYEFDWLVGRNVKIDDKPYKVLAIEFTKPNHKPKGIQIGLLVGMAG